MLKEVGFYRMKTDYIILPKVHKIDKLLFRKIKLFLNLEVVKHLKKEKMGELKAIFLFKLLF